MRIDEARLLAGDHDVAVRDEVQTGACANSIHRDDGRDEDPGLAISEFGNDDLGGIRGRLRGLLEAADISAGAEGPPLSGDDDRSDRAILLRRPELMLEGMLHRAE